VTSCGASCGKLKRDRKALGSEPRSLLITAQPGHTHTPSLRGVWVFIWERQTTALAFSEVVAVLHHAGDDKRKGNAEGGVGRDPTRSSPRKARRGRSPSSLTVRCDSVDLPRREEALPERESRDEVGVPNRADMKLVTTTKHRTLCGSDPLNGAAKGEGHFSAPRCGIAGVDVLHSVLSALS